jgi:FMN phosphatase YigB (HAD superfamily)
MIPSHIKHIAVDINDVLIDKITKKKIKSFIGKKNIALNTPEVYQKFIKNIKDCKNYTFGIISNTAYPQLVLDFLNLERYFNPIVFGKLIEYPKPHPEIYKEYIKQSGYRVEEIAYVDDSRKNLIYPHSLGIFTIWVTPKFRNDSYLVQRFVDLQVHNINELCTLIKK